MDKIGVRELRQNASKYLERVKAGESIQITQRGKPIARIVPYRTTSERDRLIEEGVLIRPRRAGNLLDLGPPLPLKPGSRLPSEIVSELRDE
jgi:prevent-host-death family protein